MTIKLITAILISFLFISCGSKNNDKPEQNETNENSALNREETVDRSIGEAPQYAENIPETSSDESISQDFSIKDVLKKHYDMIGQNKLSKKRTATTTGSINRGSQIIEFINKVKRPNKLRAETHFNNMESIQGFDGNVGWMFAEMMEPRMREIKGEQLKMMEERADMDGLVYQAEKLNYSLKPSGIVDLPGGAAYKIIATKDDGTEIRLFISISNFLLVQTTVEVIQNNTKMVNETYYRDYKSIDGIRRPFKVLNSVDGKPYGSIEIQKIEFDLEMDDSIFSIPE